MSFEAVTWAKNLPYDACEHGPFRVLLILAEHANSEGRRAFRSKRHLAKTLEVSERSIQRWYERLIAAGLIRIGDQAYVQHIPANRRPVVYDLCMRRGELQRQAQLPEDLGETGLSTGETTAVALGETTAVALRTKDINHPKESSRASHSSPWIVEDVCRGRKGAPHVEVGGYCANCSERLVPYDAEAHA